MWTIKVPIVNPTISMEVRMVIPIGKYGWKGCPNWSLTLLVEMICLMIYSQEYIDFRGCTGLAPWCNLGIIHSWFNCMTMIWLLLVVPAVIQPWLGCSSQFIVLIEFFFSGLKNCLRNWIWLGQYFILLPIVN